METLPDEDDAKLALRPCPQCSKSNMQFTGAARFTSRREYKVRCTCGFEGWAGWVYDRDKETREAEFMPVQKVLRAADVPEFEPGIESTKLLTLADAKIVVENRVGNPLPPGTRTVGCFLFEIGSEEVEPLLVKKVRLCAFRAGLLSPLFVLDYRLPHMLALPQCFAVGQGGILETAVAGEFRAEIISYVAKKGSA